MTFTNDSWFFRFNLKYLFLLEPSKHLYSIKTKLFEAISTLQTESEMRNQNTSKGLLNVSFPSWDAFTYMARLERLPRGKHQNKSQHSSKISQCWQSGLIQYKLYNIHFTLLHELSQLNLISVLQHKYNRWDCWCWKVYLIGRFLHMFHFAETFVGIVQNKLL